MTYEARIESTAAELRRIIFSQWSIARKDDSFDLRKYEVIQQLAREYGRPREEVQRALHAKLGEAMQAVLNSKRGLPLKLIAFTQMHVVSGAAHALVQANARLRPPRMGRPLPQAASLPPRRASIVVLSCNRLEYLRGTLDAVHQSLDPQSFELVVVDNASTDGSVEYLRAEAERGRIHKLILRDVNDGAAFGFNIGFAYTDPSTEFVVKLDNDLRILTPDWLRVMGKIFDENPTVGMLAFDIVNVGPTRLFGVERLNGPFPLKRMAYWPMSPVLTIPRRVLERIGYYNEFEGYPRPGLACHDRDYYMRLLRLGFSTWLVKDLKCYHQDTLDKTLYASYVKDKNERGNIAYQQTEEELGRYDAGTAPLGKHYEKYAHCRFPEGTRVLELSSQHAGPELKRAAGDAR